MASTPLPVDFFKALTAPLRFAARADFAHLERVKDLEATLLRAATHLQTRRPACAPGLQAFIAALPSAAAPREVRVAALRLCLAHLERLVEPAGRAAADLDLAPRSAAPAGVATRPAQRGASPAPPRRAAGIAPSTKSAGASAKSAAPATKSTARPPAAVSPAASPGLSCDSPIQYLRGVGPKVAAMLARRHLASIADLLRFLPRRYQGRTGCDALGALQAGLMASVEGDVQAIAYRPMRGRRTLEVILTDGTGALHLMWFRVPGRGFAEQFSRGQRLRAAGEVKRFQSRFQMVHPEVTHLDSLGEAGADDSDEEVIQPLYLEIEGLHPKQLRRLISQALPLAAQLIDPLPKALRAHRNLLPLGEAICSLHAPPATASLDDLDALRTPWHQRLIYDELITLQLAVLRGKVAVEQERGHALHLPHSLGHLAGEILPFPATGAQARVLEEIEADLRRARPMQRLLQGDVGSGKTAVALTAAAAAARAGLQVALMAPTELLAEQHARTALKILAPAGIEVALLTGHTPAAERRRILAELREGRIQVLLGTHALIQESMVFKALGLGIVDEQHRFGVMQRARLRELGQQSLGATPHMLVMTATPIPRTLALTVYGDLDVSVIDELPPGRTPVRTTLFRDKQRAAVYAKVRDAVEAGRQAYVVFPLVEESDKEGMDALRDATSSATELSQGPLAGLRLGLLHGRLASDDKDAVMRAFARHDIDVLVATTVIEVGIDVANATVMVVEHAERFGLSQLHQLRGRVGRGAHASECLLLMHFRPTEDAFRRLAVMEETSDGFRIAEEDLAIRGPGDFIGTRQAGLPMLSLANLARDQALLVLARADAQAILAADPHLQAAEHTPLAALLADSRLGLAQVG